MIRLIQVVVKYHYSLTMLANQENLWRRKGSRAFRWNAKLFQVGTDTLSINAKVNSLFKNKI